MPPWRSGLRSRSPCPRRAISAAAASWWSIWPSATRRWQSTTARPHRPRPAPTCSSDADGQVDPRKSRDTGLGVGVPGTVAGLAPGAGALWLGQVHPRRPDRAGGAARPRGDSGRGRPARFAPAGAAAAGAVAGDGCHIPQSRRRAAGAGRHRWSSAISPIPWRRSAATARAPSMSARSPTRSSPRCAAPAA